MGAIVQSILSDIRSGKAAVLVGAGLSMQAPTELPSGGELKDAIVGAILNDQRARQSWHRIRRHSAYQKAVPELVFQEVFNSIGTRLTAFFQILNDAEPNLGHRCLGALNYKYGVDVLTTNFDRLIELGSSKRCRVTHLHGSVDRPRGLIVRLNQVGRGLAVSQRGLLRRRLRNKTLLVVGYSGTDLDIMSELRTSGMRQVVWLLRPGSRDATKANASTLKEVVTTRFVSADILAFFRQIAIALGLSVGAPCMCASHPMKPNRDAILSDASESVSFCRRIGVAHNILFRIGCFEAAAQTALRAIRDGAGENADEQAWLLNGAADAYRCVGRTMYSTRCAQRALRLCPSAHSYYRAGSWNLLGLARSDTRRTRPQDASFAIKAFRKSLELLREGRRPQLRSVSAEVFRNFVARVHNNLGLALAEARQYGEAMEQYRRSLTMKRRLGDTVGIVTTLLNLVKAGHRVGYRWNRLTRWTKEADRLIGKYTLVSQRLYYLRVVGAIRCETGQIATGRRLFQEGLLRSRTYPMDHKEFLDLLREYKKA